MSEEKVKHIKDENFEQEVIKSDIPTLVDFWAPWCGPCLMVAPVVEELADKYKGQVKMTKINVDENPMVAQMFQIMSIPTLMVFKDGEVVGKIIGFRGKEPLEELIKKALQ
ncbi:MAG: thioredoxin [Deltaproteobacteria bacterium]|nr:thioredoxin [Deltaproteobacteria bacterium]